MLRTTCKQFCAFESEISRVSNSPERQKSIDAISSALSRLTPANSSQLKPIAIEVDGPSHYYINSTKYTSYSKLKHKILTNLGYTVLHVPYFEWNKLNSLREKESYMSKKLQEANKS